jgi:hypothetical protein
MLDGGIARVTGGIVAESRACAQSDSASVSASDSRSDLDSDLIQAVACVALAGAGDGPLSTPCPSG